jgi:folate-binding protein YgfZ
VPVVHLSDRAVLSVAGQDARSFLNGLVTQDVQTLAPGTACYAGLLTPQGKALFDFFIASESDDTLLMDVAAHRAPDLLKRLTMYKLRAAVTLTARPDLAAMAGWGGTPMPDGGWPDPRLVAMGWRCIGPIMPETTAAVADYHAHRISHGVPDTADIGIDQLLWLETNADLLHGVSFTKGCYVGQENTARMHHRGKVRKRICRVTSTEGLPERGTAILAGDKEAGHLLGVMGDQGLALLRLEFVESGAVLMAGGEPVRVDVAGYIFHY